MPDKDSPGNEPEKRAFINEKIVRPKMTGRQIAKRILLLGLGAVFFGLLAAVTFAVSEPLAERYLGAEETGEASSISIPKDELETTAAAEPSEEETETGTEPIEEMVRNEVEKYEFSMEDLTTMYASLNALVQKTDRGIVTVHSVRTQVDWFNNPVETAGLYAGAIIAATQEEYLILTSGGAVQDADSLEITLPGGSQVIGTLKAQDQTSGMAVISVAADQLNEEMENQIQVLELGNSYAVKQGDLIFLCGSPAGVVHSTKIGRISYVAKNVPVMDGVSRLFYTDAGGSAPLGTFLFDAKGQLIGWATDEYQAEDSQITVMRSLSDYKAVLEKLSNGMQAPYLGIQGQEVPESKQTEGMPSGIYVSRAEADSPAYEAGIQSGDIITRIGDSKISGMKDFQNSLDRLTAGSIVTVEIQRYGREAFASIEYEVTIGAR